MKRDLPTHSNFLPPDMRDALIKAAAKGDIDLIDHLTVLASRFHPDLVRNPDDCRPEYVFAYSRGLA